MRALWSSLLAALLLLVPVQARAGAVAVLYFENQGQPNLEALKVGLAQMLVTDIKSSGDVDVVERQRLQAVLDELDLGHKGLTSEATAAKVGKLLGAQYLVMGTYFELMGTLRIDARVVDVETGRIVHAYGANDATTKFLTIEKDIAGSLAASLADLTHTSRAPTRSAAPDTRTADAGTASATTATAVSPTTPDGSAPKPPKIAAATVIAPDPEAIDAAVAYSEGLIHLDQKDLPRAREAFERAVAADPQLDAAKAELARMTL